MNEGTGDAWVVVRQTISNGRRWYLARSGSGQFCTENKAKAARYPTLADAEWTVKLEQHDLDMGRGRGGVRVWAERA